MATGEIARAVVEHFEMLNRTPVVQIATSGLAELIVQGLADPVITILNYDDEALLARVEGVPAGVLTFTHQKWDRSIFVKFGYVLRARRRQGIYRALWDKLVEIARERKVPEILGSTAVSNSAMQGVMARLGRTAFALQYRFKVEPPPGPCHRRARAVDSAPCQPKGEAVEDRDLSRA